LVYLLFLLFPWQKEITETEFFSFLNTAFANISHKCTVCSELDIFYMKKEHQETALDVLCKWILSAYYKEHHTHWLVQKCKTSLKMMTEKLLPSQTKWQIYLAVHVVEGKSTMNS
jgi:phage FluMu protein Com